LKKKRLSPTKPTVAADTTTVESDGFGDTVCEAAWEDQLPSKQPATSWGEGIDGDEASDSLDAFGESAHKDYKHGLDTRPNNVYIIFVE
jgi:hypothetical protein